MVEVYAHSPGFLWLLAVVLFLEIEFQLLAKLKKIAASTEMPERGLLIPQTHLLIPTCVKTKHCLFLVPSFDFLANNASRALLFLTEVLILLFQSPSLRESERVYTLSLFFKLSRK